jgi:hypothetical protein
LSNLFHREAINFARESGKFRSLSKNSHLTLAMAEQDAITPLASGVNQAPAVLRSENCDEVG